jgi:ribosomal protein S18 acetylase RimI-like enzyme
MYKSVFSYGLGETKKIFVKYGDIEIARVEYKANKSGGEIEILKISVEIEHRRKGFARELIKEIISQNPGFKTIFAITQKSNEDSNPFYKRMGFHIASVIPGFYNFDGDEEKETAVIYIKNICE